MIFVNPIKMKDVDAECILLDDLPLELRLDVMDHQQLNVQPGYYCQKEYVPYWN